MHRLHWPQTEFSELLHQVPLHCMITNSVLDASSAIESALVYILRTSAASAAVENKPQVPKETTMVHTRQRGWARERTVEFESQFRDRANHSIIL